MADGKRHPNFVTDEIYEFSAPRFYDFINGETEEDMRKAELWFDITSSYALLLVCQESRPVDQYRLRSHAILLKAISCRVIEGLYRATKKSQDLDDAMPAAEVVEEVTPDDNKPAAKILSSEVKEEVTPNENKPAAEVLSSEVKEEVIPNKNKPAAKVLSSDVKEEATLNEEIVELNGSLPNPAFPHILESVEKQPTSQEICTPRPPPTMSKKIDPRKTDSNNQKTAKKISSLLRNPSALKSKTLPVKSANPSSMRKQAIMTSAVGTPNFGQENQAIKRQKLESGKAKKILDVKPQNLPHKTKPGANGSTFSSAAKTRKEDRKMYIREPVPQFISTAEMM
ncbi:hypothetical protein HAX54_003901 [Datura stramonium]|uniref:Uncharacterized protein n=1 Tax=Datura stramonium TaxID=4076 RepID=A0ABS8T6U5_DATST|nr:hypothetical protein [Datura stramonium]